MTHALIIDENRAVGRVIENRLTVFGFDSPSRPNAGG
jgi:hypothetical protein